jgi:hypothetical protein
MSPLWIQVLLLQAIIYLLMVFAGRFFLGLRWRSAGLAVALTLPVPLFKVSPGSAGLVFPADIVAVIFVLQWLFGGVKARPDSERFPTTILFLAALILLVLPSLSTAIGYVFYPEAVRGMNYVAATTVRQFGYLMVFWAMARKMQWEEHPDRFIILQCLAFTAVAACGLLQYTGRVNLDLWYEIQGVDPTFQGYGGGFMGLYRGAVGAYGIGIVAALTILLPRLKSGLILAPLATALIFGMILAVGSRQGIAIGAFAFFLSLILSVRSLPAGTRFVAFLRPVFLLLLMGVVVLLTVNVAAPAGFREWIAKRYAGFESADTLVDMAKSRDVSGMTWAIDNLKDHPMMAAFGLGLGTEGAIGPIFVKYGDHELLNVWQVGGVPLLLCYILFLLMLLVHFHRYRFMTDPANRACVVAAFAVLLSSIPLLYGHFFMLNAGAGNAPVGYWDWALFGGALGILTKPETVEVSEDETELYAASAI